MMSFRNLILVLLIVVIDCSLFYSQLLGADFGREDQGYVASLSFGDARQFSDVSSEFGGWSVGISLGKNVYYREESLFSFHLLGNMEYGVTKGLDDYGKKGPFENEILTDTDYDLFFYNYKTSMFSMGIDGKLSYNKARAEQRWYLSLILGGNVGVFTTKMDIKDRNGAYYTEQFNNILNVNPKERKKELRNILDGKYETKAEGFGDFPLKTKLMPSLGLEFGYDFNDYLSIFIVDKLYYSNSNEIDAQSHVDSGNDFVNCLRLGANLYLYKGLSSGGKDYRRADFKSDELPSPGYRIPQEVQDHNYPEVKIIEPEKRPYHSDKNRVFIKAKINNIESALDVKCKVNGKEVEFEFSPQFVRFFAQLEPGDNKIQVYGKNSAGQSRDVISINYKGDVNEISRPEIVLLEPREKVFYSEEEIFTIKARIHDIDSDENIEILANGHPFKSYTFNEKTSEFKIKVRLAEGLNSFVLKASNDEGKSTDSFDIYYKVDPDENKEKDSDADDNSNDEGNDVATDNSKRKPQISFLSPDSKISYLNGTDLLELRAKITGVSSSEDITISVNERPVKYFDFNAGTGIVTDKFSLYDDVSTIKITAKNMYGISVDDLTVYLDKEPPKAKDETIVFVNVEKPDKDCKTSIEVNIKERVAKKKIKLFLNQFEIRNFRYDDDEGVLKSSLYLDEGANVIKVIINNNGEETSGEHKLNCGIGQDDNQGDDQGDKQSDSQDDSQGYEEDDDLRSPEIDIIYPENNLNIENDIIRLKAKLSYVEDKHDVKISLNGRSIDEFDFDLQTGNLFAELNLTEGENNLLIRVSNSKSSEEKEISFTYEIPIKAPPAVMINSPRNRFKSDRNTVIFRASIENVTSIDDVYVTLNGNDFTDFSYDEKLGIIFSQLPLKLGKNTLRVDAENKLGSDYDEVTFEYRSKIEPAIQITSPKNGIIVGAAYVPVKAIVQNVTSKRDVRITVNGSVFSSFRLENEMLSSRVVVGHGQNEIIIKAVNDYGVASDTLNVSFEGKPKKPTVVITTPNKSGETVHDRNFEFRAKVEGILHSSYVDLTLNGNDVKGVMYIRDENLIKADLKLRKGLNNISIKASNDTGSVVEYTKIFFK